MLNRPIGDFFPQRDVPRFNAEHKRMVDECRDPGSPREWLLECLERGELIGVVTEDRLTQEYFPWSEGNEIQSGLLIDGYRRWVSSLRSFGIKTASRSTFWETLSACGFKEGRTNTKRTRMVPSMEDCVLGLSKLKS